LRDFSRQLLDYHYRLIGLYIMPTSDFAITGIPQVGLHISGFISARCGYQIHQI